VPVPQMGQILPVSMGMGALPPPLLGVRIPVAMLGEQAVLPQSGSYRCGLPKFGASDDFEVIGEAGMADGEVVGWRG